LETRILVHGRIPSRWLRSICAKYAPSYTMKAWSPLFDFVDFVEA
jgi:hypothetical protein